MKNNHNAPQQPRVSQRSHKLWALLVLVLLPMAVAAQVNIGGAVFGGARQANVGGHTYVNIEAKETNLDIVINAVYGGNDIAGEVATSLGEETTVPEGLEEATENHVDNTYSAFIRTSQADNKKLFIGQLFGGGNGDYTYTANANDKYDATVRQIVWDNTAKKYVMGDTTLTDVLKPELAKTYLELTGGTFGYVYGGGNNATVTGATDICINNTSTLTQIAGEDAGGQPTGVALLTTERLQQMGINTEYYNKNDEQFLFSRVFGGNNKADMSIAPTWHLENGNIENLYSGGNEGRMINPKGLLMEIAETSHIRVDNVYGGCRKADVRPMMVNSEGVLTDVTEVQNPTGYNFPKDFAARTLIRGGDINNVYGGNDVSGQVFFGNAVGIYTTIRGDVYGGGNGSYPYTDNPDLKNSLLYGDFYYDVPTGKTSVQALNDFRPNAAQVSIRLFGTETDRTFIHGSVYVGGNSASLADTRDKPTVELKIGSYVIANNVFLGNNGVNMVANTEPTDVLQVMASTDKTSDGTKYNSMDLTDETTFAQYMDGCAMSLMPSVVFDDIEKGDPATYEDYSTYFGSLFCGGNVGSMTVPGCQTVTFHHRIIVYDKVVGGCNNAYVDAKVGINAAYKGGMIGTTEERPLYVDGSGNIKDRLHLNFSGLKIQPKRWNAERTDLVWNTISAKTGQEVTAENLTTGTNTADDLDRRLKGGNIYGGCYNSGRVNGNVVITISESIIDRDDVFDVVDFENGEPKMYENESYTISKRNSGVILDEQCMDVLGKALNVFGGGYGENSEIWGSTTINHTDGYVFQIFGGGEHGAIGMQQSDGTYTYDERFSTYINLDGQNAGVARYAANDENIAEVEFIYGGAFEGPVCGDTHVYLGNGRIFGSFSGSCNADIYGHTETYLGHNMAGELGFPWVRDHVYGGNDLGGRILNTQDADFTDKIRTDIRPLIYNAQNPHAAAYMEYVQGRVDNIFGGAYGNYDYRDRFFSEYTDEDGFAKDGFYKPYMKNAFVNFKPNSYSENMVRRVYGAGEGHTFATASDLDRDKSQDRSYVLIDIPEGVENFANMAVFGAGDYSGVGVGVEKAVADANADGITAAAVVDLMSGQIGNVYGASYQEGFTRRTIVNVPSSTGIASTIVAKKIFAGAYGLSNTLPCDAYEATLNYQSEDATASALYGGNNNARRTFYGTVNVSATVWSDKAKGYQGTVYGAGLGVDSWSQYTEVNLLPGALVYEAYGGGEDGKVINIESLVAWKAADNTIDTTMPDGYTDEGLASDLAHYFHLANDIEAGHIKEIDHSTGKFKNITKTKYNTNVNIHEGATVAGYCYGGGLGHRTIANSGDVYGTTYIALLGGKVNKDLYAAGTSGDVKDNYGVGSFMAGTTAYIRGGTARNVYGGGWEGGVGKHEGDIAASHAEDILGETHVIVGHMAGESFVNGLPAVERNAYGGGEGGAVFGTTNLTLYDGYIGYRYFTQQPTDDAYHYETRGSGYYQEKIFDETSNTYPAKTDQLNDCGNLFGGGYVDNSSVDITHVTIYGGQVRGCAFGGGEIAAIGRGVVEMSGEANSVRVLQGIYKGGETHVYMYDGHVLRHVFGGGRGYDNLQRVGTLYSDGFVFGSTDVHIRGGEVGSREGLNRGFGNVFGGGDVGYVYSAIGKKVGERESDDQLVEGLPTSGGGYYYVDGVISNGMTMDCSVDVEAYSKVLYEGGVTIDGNSFAQGEFVPVEELNKLQRTTSSNENGKPTWDKLSADGIKIHNAVFAGGNVTSNSDQVYAGTVTVFGNVTAALRDVYNRDLIEIGTEHMGGLYGDGNLTLVDGFRDLHIDNYGTDYYGLDKEITKAEYDELSDRERAYFVLKYKCIKSCTDRKGNSYSETSSPLSADEIRELFAVIQGVDTNPTWTTEAWDADQGVPSSDYWEENGFCSLYAGRLLNTIQRADMCAIFGSRMVLQGAEDRVAYQHDYNNYTINRVDEVSLNRRSSQAGDTEEKDKVHGNYFGIYSIVNYLGNLTSDVFFTEQASPDANNPSHTAIRTTDTSNTANAADGSTTYYTWKYNNRQKSNRNNATSINKVALASGVYLEIIREETEKADSTKWGLITGVVELDLIDVRQGFGGGYVYAKNEHRPKVWHPEYGKVTLSPYNLSARTYRRFVYTGTEVAIETSGNFVHNTKQIIDDCYPNANSYTGEDAAPAHYWYIKGSIYVYDQYISAYTGSANAYAEMVNIPLTISASSHGKLTLRDVQPNLYAYFGEDGPLGAEGKVVVNNKTYHAGDPIDYWTWNTLSAADQGRFVNDVYIVVADCKIGDTEYKAGTVMLPGAVTTLRGDTPPTVTYVEDDVEKTDKDFDFFFRQANNISHDTGYILTCDLNNPGVWNDYYSLVNGRDASGNLSISTDAYNELTEAQKAAYTDGPTYTPLNSGVYGQRQYSYGEIIHKEVYDTYMNMSEEHRATLTGQAQVERAYVVTAELTATNKTGTEQHLYPGAPVYASDYTDEVWASISGKVAQARVCTSTLQLSETEYIYAGNLFSQADIDKMKARHSDLTDEKLSEHLTDAYICTSEGGGLFGGSYFQAGKAYRAIGSWCSMSDADRKNFRYNYDGLDLLIDPNYDAGHVSQRYGFKPQYDGYMPGTEKARIDATTDPTSLAQYAGCIPLKPRRYSQTQPIDYEAEYTGTSPLTYTGPNGTVTINPGYENRIKRQAYEAIPNEKVHWSPVVVTDPGAYYIVKEAFISGDFPYTVGQVLTSDQYRSLGDKQDKIDVITIDAEHAGPPDTDGHRQAVTYYFCREDYTIGEHGEGRDVNTLGIKQNTTPTTYTTGQTVPRAVVISSDNYEQLVNKQGGFVIHGTAPVETSTFYVSRESDIYDLSKEKIITVIYLYEYQESDESGNNITPVSERHVLNIHINFKSGIPEIGELSEPGIVLPGSTVALRLPSVEPGAFEITSSGWELFTNQVDADTHQNGQAYYNNSTPMYWYQDDYWVAYYAQTYLGKTYSNAVQFKVANYHDLKKVMDDKEHHYYIDHKDVKREPKIYINDYTEDGVNSLDLLKDLIDLTHVQGTVDEKTGAFTPISGGALDGHTPLQRTSPDDTEKPMRGGKYLDFILRTNITAPGASPAGTVPGGSPAWTPIASGEGECFSGTLHGDGHYISGLDQSLFGHLCGNVYNLGVMGSFTSAGIADSGDGFMENCWAMTTATAGFPGSDRAVFGRPEATDGTVQIRNCYYLEKPEGVTTYYSTTDDGNHGLARPMPLKAFYNGTVAYNLNDFYLYKRLYDHNTPTGTVATYGYLKDSDDASALTLVADGKYPEDYNSRYAYVEGRYADGDFIYAGGTIPEEKNIRLVEEVGQEDKYYPIWPDDYIFFGQALNYGHVEEREHQEVPSPIITSSERILKTVDGNRVYRAPAYFRNNIMDVAHFNPYAVFAQTKKNDDSYIAYRNMTAIDFTGGNGDLSGGYKEGWTAPGGSPAGTAPGGSPSGTAPGGSPAGAPARFFPPLLDDDGLSTFQNVDLTSNLLVYTHTVSSGSPAGKTATVIKNYQHDPAYTETNNAYRTVRAQSTTGITCHWVQLAGEAYTTTNDHLLVDKQDFNCPISYTMGSDCRMWYQRKPDNYVGKKKTDGNYDTKAGWEAISLPFMAELVTTDTKGEITHFYGGSEVSKNDTDTKIGHEYWLREYTDMTAVSGSTDTGEAQFNYPSEVDKTAANKKVVNNTFLWDYYYQAAAGHNHLDKNKDTYQTYYEQPRTYEGYPLVANGCPYLIGFPGERYYEFDLSGVFEAKTTDSPAPTKIGQQTITFASDEGYQVQVSDTEIGSYMDGHAVTFNGNVYTFKPSYLNEELTEGYVLSDDGSAYIALSGSSAGNTALSGSPAEKVQAFRPYFTKKPASTGGHAPAYRRIVFSNGTATPHGQDFQPDLGEDIAERLDIATRQGKIVVTSGLNNDADVAIYNTSGIPIDSYTIKPGETRETLINTSGVYIVRAAAGRYTKKLTL